MDFNKKMDMASLALANPSSKQSPAKKSTKKPSGWISISSHLNQGDFWKIPPSENQTPPLRGSMSTWPSLAHHVQHSNASLLHQTACQLRRRPHIHILDLPPNTGYQSPPGWHYILRIGNPELNLRFTPVVCLPYPLISSHHYVIFIAMHSIRVVWLTLIAGAIHCRWDTNAKRNENATVAGWGVDPRFAEHPPVPVNSATFLGWSIRIIRIQRPVNYV